MTKVTLRKKDISGNRQSLYLDYYPPIANPDTGKPTRREFLGLYLYNNAKKAIEKQENKDTEAIAENIRAKRLLEIQNRQFGFLSKDKLNANFIEYFKALAEKRKASNHDNWISAYHHLITYTL